MANFDPNHWYQLTVKSSSTTSVDGSTLFDQGKGSVFLKNSNSSNPAQQWQLFPFNSSYYVLRTQESGPKGYLSVTVSSVPTTPGNTIPEMRNITLSDTSMFWAVTPWGDGTFFMANAANGTNWHLTAKTNGLMSMSSNITAPQNGQSFSFTPLGKIDNAHFSSIAVPSSISTSATTGTASAKTSIASSGRTGLSTGAAAGIGAAIAVVVLIALLVLGFIILRRRRRRANSLSPDDPNAGHEKEHLSPYGELIPSDSDTNEQRWRAGLLPQELDHSGPSSLPGERNDERLMPPELDLSRPTSDIDEQTWNVVMPHELDHSRPNSRIDEQNWKVGMPHELDPETRAGAERRQSPFRPGHGPEQKAVMPQDIFPRNDMHEPVGHPMERGLGPDLQGYGERHD